MYASAEPLEIGEHRVTASLGLLWTTSPCCTADVCVTHWQALQSRECWQATRLPHLLQLGLPVSDFNLMGLSRCLQRPHHGFPTMQALQVTGFAAVNRYACQHSRKLSRCRGVLRGGMLMPHMALLMMQVWHVMRCIVSLSPRVRH